MHNEQPYQPPTSSRSAGGAPGRRSSAADIPVNTPTGFYILIGASTLGFVASFFNTSQDSMVFSVLLLLMTVLAVGLLARADAVRRLLVGVTAIAIVLSGISLAMLLGYQQRMNTATATYEKSMGQINPEHLTAAQKTQIKAYQRQMTDLRSKAGRALGYSFALLGTYVVGSAAIAVYLTRPPVRAAFAQPVRRI